MNTKRQIQCLEDSLIVLFKYRLINEGLIQKATHVAGLINGINNPREAAIDALINTKTARGIS